MLLLKVFVIFLIPFWLFIPPIDAEVLQVDSDFDGKMDQWRHMSNDNKIIKIEYDKNGDNNIDQVDIYEMQNIPIRAEWDRNFDGKMDQIQFYNPDGSLIKV